MLNCKNQGCCPENCIRPCSKGGYCLFRIFYFEFYFNSMALTNPVALHYLDSFRPMLQLFNVPKQLVSILRYPEEPLLKLFFGNIILASPAFSVLHLLICKHCAAALAPV